MDYEILDTFWKNVDRWRAYYEFSWSTLSESIGMAPKSLKSYHQKKTSIPLSKAIRIAEIFNIPMQELFDDWQEDEWDRYLKRNK